MLNQEFDTQKIVEQLQSHEYQADVLKCISFEQFL